jgi:hypothetical protein
VFSIEHLELQSTAPGRRHHYENLVYACRHCNRSRGRRPRGVGDEQLLDPTVDRWSEHFMLLGAVLLPIGDRALALEAAYRLNSRKKQLLRRRRREIIENDCHLLTHARDLIKMCRAKARQATSSQEASDWLDKAAAIQKARRSAIKRIVSLAAVPGDRPGACLCAARLGLPDWFQAWNYPQDLERR